MKNEHINDDWTECWRRTAMKNDDPVRRAIYEKACALDNQDVPLEEWPEQLITALATAGYAVLPVSLPPEILGEAAMAGVFETGNPKHGWDYLLNRLRINNQLTGE